MDSSDIDKLAFALLTSIKWAVDGGKIEQLPKVHEELSSALSLVFNEPDLTPFRRKRQPIVLDTLQKCNGDIEQAAKVLGLSSRTVERYKNIS